MQSRLLSTLVRLYSSLAAQLWVYYTSCILFFGAEFTQVDAETGGDKIEPMANATRVTTEERDEQGVSAATPTDSGNPLPTPLRVNRPARSYSLLAPILKHLQGRRLLISREALQHVISLCIWLAIAVVSIFAGWLLLAASLVGALTHWLGWSWLKAAGVAGGLHILVALVAGLLMWKRLTTARWFTHTNGENDHSGTNQVHHPSRR